LPQPASEQEVDPPWRIVGASYQTDMSKVSLDLAGPPGGAPPGGAPPDVFPLNGDFISAAALEITDRDGQVTLQFSTLAGAAPPAAAGFVLVSDRQAWGFNDVAIATGTPDTPHITESPGLWLVFLFAVVGGVLLNLMPCVFPVLSIKLFSLIQANHQ